MAVETVETVVRSRRAVLFGAVGAVVASVAAAVGRPAPVRAGVDGDVVLGVNNDSTTMTRISMTTSSNPAFMASNPVATGVGIRGEGDTAILAVGDSVGVEGSANTGIGLRGISGAETGIHGQSADNGIRGFSTDAIPTSDFDVVSHNTGVIGLAGGLEDLLPDNTDETGVYGFADLSTISTGVWGDSIQGFGVFGSGDVGVGGNGFLGLYGLASGAGASGVLGRGGPGQTGVYGFAGSGFPPAPTPNVAVQAKAETASQIALNVIGRAKFSQSGRSAIATNKSSLEITKSGVTTASYIIATLQTKRTGIYVQSVVPAAGKFTIYLNKVVPGTTYVGWFVVN